MSKSSEDEASRQSKLLPSSTGSTRIKNEEMEDCPKFRSVAMVSRPGGHSFDGPSIGLGPPPVIMRPLRGVMENESTKYVAESKKKDIIVVCDNGPMWRVTDSMLRPLPDDYDVSRTSRYLVDHNPCDISMRIASVFKENSIQADYDLKKAKATCSTTDFVKFQVRLHNGRGMYANGIIVEIQRRRGSSMNYLKLCSSILNAAEGINNDVCNSYLSPHLKKPLSSMQCLRGGDRAFESSLALSVGALTEVEKLLCNKRSDVNVLGMQFLCKLLDSETTSLKTCMRAFSAVVHGTNYPTVHEKILTYLQFDNDKTCSNDARVQSMAFQAMFRGLNLRVVNPCPDSKKNRELDPTFAISPWILESFVPLLMTVMKDKNPRNMLWSIKSLDLIISHSEDGKGRIIECGATTELFEELKEIGKAQCACLQKQAESILNALR